MSTDTLFELEVYRRKVHGWLAEQAPIYGKEARKGLDEAEDLALGRRWQRLKFDNGYAGISWPKDYGGAGLSQLHQTVFAQEEGGFGFPTDYFSISLGQPVPIMQIYATEAEKQRYIPPALRGEEIWCQLFSEPAAGSDLAGLRMRAVRDGDDWVLSGQKLWTSWAQYSDFAVVVARHDPSVPKHQGLTYFWLDMRTPGVTVRPVKLIDGGAHVNEVFFDDVRIPDSQRLGKVGEGFKVALETLFIERYTAATDPTGFGPDLSLFVSLARKARLGDRPALDDGRVRSAVADAYRVQKALSTIQSKALMEMAAGRQPGGEGSIHKLSSVRVRQRLSELAVDLVGPSARLDSDASGKDDWVASWISAPTGRIAGGTDEILLNTIAERVLGLPQDYRPDKAVPFDQIKA